MDGDAKTLYVGNLHQHVTEEFMYFLFTQMGTCVSCKIIYEPHQDPYCFVEFADHMSALQALNTMNGREVMGKPMKVNWATSPNSKNVSDPAKRVDTSDHFHIFCGDLSPDIDTEQLRKAFSAFGDVSDCKVICDLGTGKSKGYGFISFVNKDDAQKAINEMNGAWLGTRAIRTNWATRKPPAPVERSRGSRQPQKLNYDDVYAQASETNTTVYIGGIQDGVTDDVLRDMFTPYGHVAEIRCFTDKGFAFVRLESKSAAAQAIVGLNGHEVAGHTVRCHWGKESNDAQRQQQQQQSAVSQNYGYGGQQNYGSNWGNGYGVYSGQQPQQQPWGQQQWSQQQWGQQFGSGDPNSWPQQQQQQAGYGGYQQQAGNYNYGGGYQQ